MSSPEPSQSFDDRKAATAALLGALRRQALRSPASGRLETFIMAMVDALTDSRITSADRHAASEVIDRLGEETFTQSGLDTLLQQLPVPVLRAAARSAEREATKERRRRERTSTNAPEVDPAAPREDDPAERAADHDATEALIAAIKTLGDAEREALIAYMKSGRSKGLGGPAAALLAREAGKRRSWSYEQLANAISKLTQQFSGPDD